MANSVLSKTKNEGRAVRAANSAMADRFWHNNVFQVDAWTEEAREASAAARASAAKVNQIYGDLLNDPDTLEDRREYDEEDLAKAYELTAGEASDLAAKIRAGFEMEGQPTSPVPGSGWTAEEEGRKEPSRGGGGGARRVGQTVIHAGADKPRRGGGGWTYGPKTLEEMYSDAIAVITGDASTETVHLSDTIDLDDESKVRFTKDGYMTATPLVARTGIQVYSGPECGRPDMDVVRVYRPPEEVFNKDALKSFTHRPVTLDHPRQSVSASNWRQLSRGHTGDEILRDGERFRVPMALMDAEAVQAYKAGKRQLSWGYDCDLDWTPGVTDSGEQYDAVQRNLRANHLAVVTTARGGPELMIGDDNGESKMNMKTVMVDGIEVQIPDTAASVVVRTLQRQQDEIKALRDAAKKRDDDDDDDEEEDKRKDDAIKAKDAEITTLKKQLADATNPSVLDALVRDRSSVGVKAQQVMGSTFKTDGKTVEQIRKEVVASKLGDACKDWDDKQIAASFATFTAGISTDHNNGHTVDHAVRVFGSRPGFATADSDKDKAYAERDQFLTDAWRGGQK